MRGFIPCANKYVWQSGTGAIANNDVPGDLAPVQIFDDLNADQIAAIPLTNTHRDVDTELVRADEEGEYLSSRPNCELDIYVTCAQVT